MECLRNLILVDGCGSDATLIPASNNYLTINSLPGVSLKQLISLTNEEQQSWRGVWDDVTLRASKRFATDFRQAMVKRYKLRSVTQGITLPRVIDSTTLKAGASEYRGIVIELNNSGDDYYPSVLQQVSIDKLFYFHNTANATAFPFHVFDLDTGKRIHAFTKDVVTGWNIINYHKRFNVSDYSTTLLEYPRRIFIAFQSGGNSTPALDVSEWTQNNNCEYLCSTAKIQGGTATIASTITSVTTGNNTHGLSALITVGCSWENFVCQNQQLFETAMWYLCGIELMNENIFSDRLNQFTTIGMAKAQKLHDEYEIMYSGGTITRDGKSGISYQGALPQVVDAIDISLADECVECNEMIKIVEAVL